MANLVIRRIKKPTLLDKQRAYLNSLKLRLFTDDITPDDTTLASSLHEPTDSGYAAYAALDFAAPYVNGSNYGQTDATRVIFTFNHNAGDQTIHGWFLTDPADAENIVMSARVDPAFTITAPGQLYAVTPSFQLADL